jgi:hypothetical protein
MNARRVGRELQRASIVVVAMDRMNLLTFTL